MNHDECAERAAEETKVTILTGDPVVACIAEMQLNPEGIVEMADWVREKRPECMPDDYDQLREAEDKAGSLFPHAGFEMGPRSEDSVVEVQRAVRDNELLVELAGRKCYDSFGLKAGKKTNAEYIANTQAGEIPHASIMYHAKMTFFIAGISRRVSHELIRHYVGADRDEEGSPSQESTRYVEHPGRYIAHPRILGDRFELELFEGAMRGNYAAYNAYIWRQTLQHEEAHGEKPKGLDRKRIFESASPYLAHSCETSFIWTTNPIALAKLIRERDNEAADLEFARLAKAWKKLAVSRWPNLFPHMKG